MTKGRSGELDARTRWQEQNRQQRIRAGRREARRATPPGPWSAVLGLAGAAAALAVAGLLIVLWPGAEFAYDAGLAGRAGTFTATNCWTTGTGKGANHHCEGIFAPTDGSGDVQHVVLTNTRAALDHPLAVRRRPDGGYAVPDLSHQLFDLTGCVGLLAMSGGAIGMIGDGPRKRLGQRELLRQQPWLAMAYTGILTFPIGIALALLLGAAAFVSGIAGH